MRKNFRGVLCVSIAAAFFMTLLGGGSLLSPLGEVAIAEAGPNVTVSPVPVKPKKGKLLIAGSGLKPGQVLYIHTTMDNIWSDITYLVAGKGKMLVANKYGAFASWWKLKPRYFKKLLIPGKVYAINIVDGDGNTLATVPLVIDKAKSKKKKKKK